MRISIDCATYIDTTMLKRCPDISDSMYEFIISNTWIYSDDFDNDTDSFFYCFYTKSNKTIAKLSYYVHKKKFELHVYNSSNKASSLEQMQIKARIEELKSKSKFH